jgi:Alkylmercury lyase
MTMPKAGVSDPMVRVFVYRHIVEHERPPTMEETAAGMDLPPAAVRAAYGRLHDGHALLLESGAHTIRMAWPFSGIPTPFRVQARGRRYWANCAWDALGIPALLQTDARIESVFADTGEPVTLTVADGGVQGQGLAHFAVPFRRWYAALVFT